MAALRAQNQALCERMRAMCGGAREDQETRAPPPPLPRPPQMSGISARLSALASAAEATVPFGRDPGAGAAEVRVLLGAARAALGGSAHDLHHSTLDAWVGSCARIAHALGSCQRPRANVSLLKSLWSFVADALADSARAHASELRRILIPSRRRKHGNTTNRTRKSCRAAPRL